MKTQVLQGDLLQSCLGVQLFPLYQQTVTTGALLARHSMVGSTGKHQTPWEQQQNPGPNPAK